VSFNTFVKSVVIDWKTSSFYGRLVFNMTKIVFINTLK
jgi:hypothetical protein